MVIVMGSFHSVIQVDKIRCPLDVCIVELLLTYHSKVNTYITLWQS